MIYHDLLTWTSLRRSSVNGWATWSPKVRNVTDQFTIKQLGFQPSRGPPTHRRISSCSRTDRSSSPAAGEQAPLSKPSGGPPVFQRSFGRYSGSARSARVFCQRWKRFILTYSWTMFHHYLITILGQDLTFRPFWGVLLRCSISVYIWLTSGDVG